jgi:hypothetical protein
MLRLASRGSAYLAAGGRCPAVANPAPGGWLAGRASSMRYASATRAWLPPRSPMPDADHPEAAEFAGLDPQSAVDLLLDRRAEAVWMVDAAHPIPSELRKP